MVPGRGGHYPAGSLLWREITHQEQTAAHLEGANRLQVLAFQMRFKPETIIECHCSQHWGRWQKLGNDGASALDIGHRR